jgi:hypothetical protein
MIIKNEKSSYPYLLARENKDTSGKRLYENG